MTHEYTTADGTIAYRWDLAGAEDVVEDAAQRYDRGEITGETFAGITAAVVQSLQRDVAQAIQTGRGRR